MSRPPQAMDTSQAELEEEEAISGTGEGDEIMEEAEEQEGYSRYPFLLYKRASYYLALVPTFWPSKYLARHFWLIFLTDSDLLCSIVDAYVNTNLDQLVLFITWT
jgi:hypothetical protein